MAKKVEGVCKICGQEGPLSFEHVPPRAAFNNRPVIKLNFAQAIELGPFDKAKGQIQQKGAGDYTLCPRCNNNTGAWYAKNFVEWCYQAMEILIRTEGKPLLIYMTYGFPLQILKQIVTMFFSVNSNNFQAQNQELVRFVLNREARYLSPKYRFFVYYNLSENSRSMGVAGKLNINTLKTTILSELSFPPFGYVMTIDSEPPDKRLVEITHFSQYEYSEFSVVNLKLPVLPTHTLYPGDYREKDQIVQDSLADIKFAEEHKI